MDWLDLKCVLHFLLSLTHADCQLLARFRLVGLKEEFPLNTLSADSKLITSAYAENWSACEGNVDTI